MRVKFLEDKVVYIAGAVSNRNIKEVVMDFIIVEDLLKKHGVREVLNPLGNGLPLSASWEDHMKEDIRLLTRADYVFMLEGWETSRGAKIEHRLAKELGIEIIYLNKDKQ